VESIKRMLKKIKAVKQWQVAGSFRRGKETVGDLDILVQAEDRSEATKQIQQYEAIKEVISKGKERVSVVLDNNLQIDFRFFEPEAFGSAQLYFTGSKAHNIAVRKRAVKNDWKLNEYGLFKDDKRLAGKTEESVYKRVKMDWIPPELREDRGEVEAAEQGKLPRLIELKDVRGDLHAHTKASDGLNTIEEMADAARERDYEYLAITDHSKAVSVAQGLDEKRLKNHARDVRKISDSYKDLWLLAGIEVDILKSGKLDLDEKALGELDWVVGSIHSYFDLDEKKMTDRLLSAVESGVVHCLGHPTGRMIGKRQSIPFDTEKVFKACAENNVALGINAQPERLDLPDTFCQQARELGVVFAISTDAHKIAELDFIAMGVSVARRGWLEKKHVLNTWTPNKLEKFIQRK
jgi:DNA polymerase (family 10)